MNSFYARLWPYPINEDDYLLDLVNNSNPAIMSQASNSVFKKCGSQNDVELICSRVTRALGLRFAGIDIKITDNKQYYFLECNSNPIYVDVEFKLGHPITERLVKALIESKNNG